MSQLVKTYDNYRIDVELGRFRNLSKTNYTENQWGVKISIDTVTK